MDRWWNDIERGNRGAWRETGPVKANVKLNCMERFSPYRAVNTLRLGYTNQSVNAV